jgi:hypothetical protein
MRCSSVPTPSEPNREKPRIAANSLEIREQFSELPTVWRRERDSNPRYPFRYNGFQDRLFQPLTHPSARLVSTVYQQFEIVAQNGDRTLVNSTVPQNPRPVDSANLHCIIPVTDLAVRSCESPVHNSEALK